MNALLDSIVYDRRSAKVKTTSKQIDRQIQDNNKRAEKPTNKVKSKNPNKVDRVNKAVSVEKPKTKGVKNHKHSVTVDNSQFGSLTSLASTNDSKVTNKLCNSRDNSSPNKSDEIDPKQVRKKQSKNTESKTELVIKTAPAIFDYSGSIEQKFEDDLEVCTENRYDEFDEELGRNLFDEESDNYFLEAYNRPGDELVESYLEVAHKTVTVKSNEDDEIKPGHTNGDSIKPRQTNGDSIKPRQTNGDSLRLISDDEECIFLEAYNSIGYELRKTYSLMDRNATNIDRDFQARTLSITSDVQEYFNNIGDKCENEDQHVPACSTYVNYGKIINEYNNKKRKNELKEKIDDTKIQSAPTKCDTEKDVGLSQPSPNIYSNYDKTMAELRKSLQRAVIKDQRAEDDVSEDININSSAEHIYEIPYAEDSARIKFNPQTKSDFIIHELLETEWVYIKNLKKILTDYLNYFRKFPKPSQPTIGTIFGNIEDIYRQTIEFYQALLMCTNDYEAIALTFVDYKSLFNLYPIYMKNKPKADRILLSSYKSIIEDRQKKLKDRLDLMSYLLNPIQRLGRYILLLENLQRSVRKAECLDPAVEILKTNMTKGNDAIAVESILRLPDSLDLYTKGSYIDREKFIMIKPRRLDVVIFLFGEIVVFTVENITDRRDVHTTFTYYDSIQMNDLSITVVDGDLQNLQLADYPRCKKNKDDGTYIFEARDTKTRNHWAELLREKLWEQLKIVKDESKSYKPISRANSTSSARFHHPYSCKPGQSSDSRESSTKKVVTNTTDDKKTDKSNDKVKRRTKKPKSDAVKRNSKFYADPQSYKTM